MAVILDLRSRHLIKVLVFCMVIFTLAAASGCIPVPDQGTPSSINVTVQADGNTLELTLPAGSTAQAAYASAGLTPGNLDRSNPPMNTVLANGDTVRLTRVREEFDVQDVTIPFDHQVVHNESLPEGETLLIQPGVNGLQETTYRHVYEDNKEVSSNVIKNVVIKEAVPEIVMIGVQAPFASIPINGRLAYLTGGNAWVMDGSTGDRIPVVTTGDLDGRIFSLSPDGNWLLYTRKIAGSSTDTLNSLWVSRIGDRPTTPIDLKVSNVVHYADWVPGTPQTIAYSTVEPRSTAPGWQANNDLETLNFSASGVITRRKTILEPNSGGIYGWWGSTYAWSPDASQIAYSRPDGVGLVDAKTGELQPLLTITPLHTGGDWAWVPPLAWSPDGDFIYTLDHPPASGPVAPEDSPLFDLTVIRLREGPPIELAQQTGMFAYPVASPWSDKLGYQIAFLQAVFPEQSENSRYRLVIMDRDGSNHRSIFPSQGSPGVDPQQVAWAPKSNQDGAGMIAVVFQGNLWLIQTSNGQSQQITGDGLTSRLDWK
jgi:hypothetical protein